MSRHARRDAAPEPELQPDAMLGAYLRGWFPMDRGGAEGPVLFYESDPRGVMPIEDFRVPRSVTRGLRARAYEIRVDTAFAEVAAACSGDRDGEWLTPRLVDAYTRLHEAGWAHSVEAWSGERLCGGLFGVAIGTLFSSETMFHQAPDAGNAALVGTALLLRSRGFTLWDIQAVSPHTARFGAHGISPGEYRRRLAAAVAPVLAREGSASRV
ncbi:MAG: leucyl/phenylalanyl-tRNA--protein transferase [Thermoleophilia bacterium]